MADCLLHARRILVVEDEYMLATELAHELAMAGAEVLGPVPTMELALAVLKEQGTFDGAILDVNLGGALVFPLADTLIERGIPLVFTTGYDPDTLPARFADVPKCGKPFTVGQLISAIGRALHA